MDSHVLLHSMAVLERQYSWKLKAIHVNHGLNPDSDNWERHCIKTCHALSVEIVSRRVKIDSAAEEGPESAARTARYAAIADEISEGQVVLTAHHSLDQAETFILQLMRGSGVSGLSGMSVMRSLPPGWLLRPFLHVDQGVLAEYAENHGLEWIRDPSNTDIRYSRNYIRHRVLPVLQQRWPAAVDVIGRSSSHLSEAMELVDMLALEDLANVQSGDDCTLNLTAYTALPFVRKKNLLRIWIKRHSGSVPPTGEIEQIARVLSEARQDASPMMKWNDICIRRYRDRVYIMRELPPRPGIQQLEWDMSSDLELPLGTLRAYRRRHDTSQEPAGGHSILIRFRRGGELIRPVRRGHVHTVKSLLQEAGIPPWLRDYIPMLLIDGKLMLIPGICMDTDFPADLAAELSAIAWELPDDIFAHRQTIFKSDINTY